MNIITTACRARRFAGIALALVWMGIPGTNVRASDFDPEWSASDECIRDYIIDPGVKEFYDVALYRRLELGIRQQYVRLRDRSTTRFDDSGLPIDPSMEGYSANSLKERQEYLPAVFGRYRFTPYFAAELSWERVRARANAFWDERTDGTVALGGPALLFHARLPNETRATPFVAIGLALLNASFDTNYDWYEGPGFTRNVSVDDTTGLILSGGCDVRLLHRVSLNFTLRYMAADVDADYFTRQLDGTRSNETSFTLPLNNCAGQLGVMYSF